MTLLKKLWLLLLQQTLGTEESTQDIKPSSTTGTSGEDDGGDTGDDGDTGDIETPETVVLPLKKASQYSVFNDRGSKWLTTSCTDLKCTFSGGASFDSEDNLLVPSGNILSDDNVWLGYDKFINEYMPDKIHPVASCYTVNIGGIENYTKNESWYQQADILNKSFKVKTCDISNGPSWLDGTPGQYQFCSYNTPTSTGYDQFRFFLAIGTDDERGLLYGNIAPYTGHSSYFEGPAENADYIYRYKNRVDEGRDKLYVWIIAVFIGKHVSYNHTNDDTNIVDNSIGHCDTTDVCTYFKKKIGEFKGDYKYSRPLAFHMNAGGGGSHAILPMDRYGNFNFCDYKYDHGDLDLRNISVTINYNDLYQYHSNPALRYSFYSGVEDDFTGIPGYYSSDPAVTLCDFGNMEITIDGEDDEAYVTHDSCADNNQGGYPFLAQQPQTFGINFDNFGTGPETWTLEDTAFGDQDYYSPSGILGFDWFRGNPLDLRICTSPYGCYGNRCFYTFEEWDWDNYEWNLAYYNNKGKHYGSLTTSLILEISGVKSSDSLNDIENASRYDCYHSSNLNGKYELTTTPNNPTIFSYYNNDIDPICCECVDNSGCIDYLGVTLSNDNSKYSESKTWYSSKLSVNIGNGCVYEYNFNNWGDDSTIRNSPYSSIVDPSPLDFNNKEVIPNLKSVIPEYDNIHDFSEASIKVTFGDVDNYNCIPSAKRCIVFDDEIGPDSILINIPDDWQNAECFKEYTNQWGDEWNRHFKVKCGTYTGSFWGGYYWTGYISKEFSECKWIQQGEIPVPDPRIEQFNIDPLDWCENIPVGEYILDFDGGCLWRFQEDCPPTGVPIDEDDPNNFFEEDVDLYAATYEGEEEDLFLRTSDVSDTPAENCRQITDELGTFRVAFYEYPSEVNGIYSLHGISAHSYYNHFDTALDLNVYCPSPCLELYIAPDYGGFYSWDREYTNKFNVVLNISLDTRESSYPTCSNNTITFKAVLESAPGTKILDENGRPYYRYYITREMIDGLELEYQEPDSCNRPIDWGGSPVTISLVD